ncbi:MAG: hypothetical protein DLM56_11235 [Pseudonocardiales bacterium]|nr:MAG: hypothetical protein DLM56_11235 [Pseudonocardiales bacterium]
MIRLSATRDGAVMRRIGGSRCRRAGALAVAGAVAGMVLAGVAGCAAGQVAETANELSAVGGSEGQVGQMALRNVSIAYPPTGKYEPGGTARLNFALVNEASGTDRLVSVSTPVASSVTGTGGSQSGGLDIAVGPLSSVQTAGTGGTAAASGPIVVLHGLRQTLRSGEPVQITFRFARAGSLTLDAIVASPVQHVSQPPARTPPPSVQD